MTHEEYLARIEAFSDSPEDAGAVLAHSASCAACRRDERIAGRALARLDPSGTSPLEIAARWSAAAAILALVGLGVQKEARGPAGSPPAGPEEARYVVVGDASGVVAHTPEGLVVGVPPRSAPAQKEIVK